MRNVNMLARRRKIEFDLSIRKYLRCVFNKLKKDNPTKTKDEIIYMMDNKYKGEVGCISKTDYIFQKYIFKNPLYTNFWYVYDEYR